MNKYMIIRSDNKSISPPMSKHEAIIKLKEYNKKGISTYLVSRSEYINITCFDVRSTCTRGWVSSSDFRFFQGSDDKKF